MHRLLLVLLFYTSSALALNPPLTNRADPEIESTTGLQRRNKILLIHAVCGFLALQVVAPLAVVIASVGRSWGPIWFKLHSIMQIFIVLPLVALAVGLAAAATTYDVDKSMDKHKLTGFVLLGLVVLQMILGGWATCAQRIKARNARDGEAVTEKRRVSNWLHIALGITILSVGGLQVTWGLSEWEKLVGTVPTWINIVHFALAGVPVAIVTPFIIVQGLLRMKRGQSFAQAFFDRPTTPSKYVPPRKLFLGGSTYRTVGQDDEKLGEQERLVGDHGQSNNELQDGGQPFESEIGWTGPATREEYEATIASSRLRNSTDSEQTIAPSDGESQAQEKHSLLDYAAPLARSGSLFEGKPSGTRSSGSTYPPVSTVSAPYFSASPSPLSTTTVSPLTLPSLSPPPPPPPPPSSLPHSSVSPRLAFMPFSGSTVVHPESAATPSESSSSVNSNPSNQAARQLNEVHSSLPVTQNLERPASSSSSDAAVCNAFGVSRHASMAGEIVQIGEGERRFSQLSSTLEETGMEVEDDGTSVLFDDSESTRLMDELERELSVSSTRSRRIRDRFEGDAEGMETNDVDEEMRLARDQSGKWAGSNKRDSSQA